MPTLLAAPFTVLAPEDALVLHAFARRGRPLCVSELLRALTGTGTSIGGVMDALTAATAAGLVAPRGHRRDEAGAIAGPLLHELTDAGRAVVEADRAV